jgi:DNA-binding MarR family transcriptional regulator
MNNNPPYDTNIELLISKVNHSMVLIRRKELAKYHIAPRQLYILHVIHTLDSRATSLTVAKEVDREVNVINRLLINLEKDGLIKRIKKTPKSKLLSLKLTRKGLEMIKINIRSEAIDSLLTFLPRDEILQMDSTLEKVLLKLTEFIPDPD